MLYKEYVFDATNKLNLTSQVSDKFTVVGKELAKIKSLDSNILEVGVAGGFIIDTILGLVPNDLDIKYRIKKDSGKIDPSCRCDYIRSLVNQTDLPKLYKVDVGHIMDEKHPEGVSINYEHVGPFSLHTEYYSMWVLDQDARVWTNRVAYKDYLNGVYNTHTLGLLAWVYHKNRSYYDVLAVHLIRGLGYIKKRDLKVGDTFRFYLDNCGEIFSKFEKEEFDHKGLRKYFSKKVGSLSELEQLINKSSVRNSDAVFKVIKDYLG